MLSSSDLETRKKEITVLVNEVNVLRAELAAKGITEIDDEDRMEAMDILNRIERRMMSRSQPTKPATEEDAA